MKKVTVITTVEVEVTEDEYERLRKSAYDERMLDCPYEDIETPAWLVPRVKKAVPATGGYISSYSWGNYL